MCDEIDSCERLPYFDLSKRGTYHRIQCFLIDKPCLVQNLFSSMEREENKKRRAKMSIEKMKRRQGKHKGNEYKEHNFLKEHSQKKCSNDVNPLHTLNWRWKVTLKFDVASLLIDLTCMVYIE